MPPKERFDRNAIIDAGFRLVRREGEGALTARSVAEELSSSTHPIYRIFPSIDALREQVLLRAEAFLVDRMLEERHPHGPFFSVGVGYLRFAREEPALFRLLAGDNGAPGRTRGCVSRMGRKLVRMEWPFDRLLERMHSDPELADLDDSALRRLLRDMWVYAHGVGALLGPGGRKSRNLAMKMLHRTGGRLVMWERMRERKRRRRSGPD